MDSLQMAIRRTVHEASKQGRVVGVSDEAKRLAARHSAEAPLPDIAAALTRECLRRGVGVQIGEPAVATFLDVADAEHGSITNP
jgi:hypothetical protein